MCIRDSAKDALAEIDSIGVQVKDLDIGLLDFPCEVEGSVVPVSYTHLKEKRLGDGRDEVQQGPRRLPCSRRRDTHTK